MKRKRNPILPKATYIGTVSTPAELVIALKAAAEPFQGWAEPSPVAAPVAAGGER